MNVDAVEPMQKKLSSLPRLAIYPWIVWGLGAAFFFFEYIARVSPGVIADDLMREFNMTATQMGLLSAFFYHAYIPMQIPVGIIVDRFSVRKILASMALLTGIGCFFFSVATDLLLAEVGRFLLGFGSAFAFVSTLKLVSIWFPGKKLGLLSGLTQSLGMLGAAAGKYPAAALVAVFGWRMGVGVMAFVFIVLACAILLVVRDKPIQRSINHQIDKTPSQPHHSIWYRIKVVFGNPQTWFNACFAGLIYAPTEAFAELWGELFFKSTYQVSNHIAAAAVGMIFIGWGLGGPITGWISDKLKLRKPILIASGIFSFIFMSIVLFWPNLSINTIYVFLFLYGIANTGLVISYAVAAEINPRDMAGTSLGFTNMASIIIGACFQPLIGKLLDLQSGMEILNGIPHYTATAFQHAMMILPICLVFSIVFAMLVRETHCHAVLEKD